MSHMSLPLFIYMSVLSIYLSTIIFIGGGWPCHALSCVHVNTELASKLNPSSPNTLLFGPQFVGALPNMRYATNLEDPLNHSSNKNALLMASPRYESPVQSSPIGRYAAPRPMGNMAEVKCAFPVVVLACLPSSGRPSASVLRSIYIV